MATEAKTGSREHLIETMLEVLKDISKNENQLVAVDQYLLKHHNIQPSLIQQLIVNKYMLDEMENDRLIVVANALFKGANYNEMQTEQYFDQKIVKTALKYKEDKAKLAFPLDFENVLIGSAEDIMVIFPYKYIGKLWLDDMLVYNPNIQRKPTTRTNKKTGVVKTTQKVSKKNIKEITQMLLDGKYLPDTTMTFNVFLENPEEDLSWDEENRNVTINKAIEIDVIDGFHRIEAILAALDKKPDLEGYLYVSIRFYDEQKAKFYLGQFNSGTPFDKTHTRLLKNYRMEDKITTDLITQSDLKGHVGKEKSPNIRLGELTTFTILADSINENFNVTNGKEKIEVTETLIRFFDYLLGSDEEAFKNNIEEVSANSWKNYHNTFPGYIAVAKKLFEKYGRTFPVDQVDKVLNNIDFSKGDNELSKIYGSSRESNSNQVKKKVTKYFTEQAEEVLSKEDK